MTDNKRVAVCIVEMDKDHLPTVQMGNMSLHVSYSKYMRAHSHTYTHTHTHTYTHTHTHTHNHVYSSKHINTELRIKRLRV
jgi:hypothetical protein